MFVVPALAGIRAKNRLKAGLRTSSSAGQTPLGCDNVFATAAFILWGNDRPPHSDGRACR